MEDQLLMIGMNPAKINGLVINVKKQENLFWYLLIKKNNNNYWVRFKIINKNL